MELTGKAKAEWDHTSDLSMECLCQLACQSYNHSKEVYKPNALATQDQGHIDFAEAELSTCNRYILCQGLPHLAIARWGKHE